MKIKKELDFTETQRNSLKKTQLEILDFFVDFCNKNNLTYYLFGGTLLGAVRHKGYIPWDDDVDLCMPYEDYYKMLNIFNGGNKYFVENYFTDHEYFYNFTKIMKRETRYCEYAYQNSKAKQNIFIDIFPIINVPQKKRISYYWYYFILTILNTRSYLRRIKTNKMDFSRKTNKNKHRIMTVLSWLLLWWCPRKLATHLKYNFLKKHGKVKSDIVSVGAGLYSRYPKNFFEGKSIVTFEERKLYAPQQPDDYLKHKYGNYLELPPEKDRIAHHFVCEFKA